MESVPVPLLQRRQVLLLLVLVVSNFEMDTIMFSLHLLVASEAVPVNASS